MSHGVAVLALHYQNDVLHESGKIKVGMKDAADRRRVLDAAARLLQGARSKGVPIVHVRIAFRPDYADCPTNTPIFRKTIELGAVRDGDWGAEFVEQLAPLQSRLEFVVTHTRISAFAGSPLEQTLRMLRVTRLVIAGVATHSVVENTVREGADLGYEITVAADACAAAEAHIHEAALTAMSLVADIVDVDRALAALS